MAAPTAEALEAELAEAEAEAGIEREEAAPAEEGTGAGDVVAEPQDRGSGESVESADADS
jgi:large subunit ribosomal protein L25